MRIRLDSQGGKWPGFVSSLTIRFHKRIEILLLERKEMPMAKMKSYHSKTIGILMLLSLVFVLPAALSAADTYPSKPVRMIVPYPAGGSSDTNARLVANKLSERLGKPVVLDFRGGAGSVIGTEAVAKAEPDGYTLLSCTAGMPILPVLAKDLPFDVVKSFAPVAKTVTSPTVLVVNANVPAKSVQELIALAKQKPNELIFDTAGIGSSPHMAAELFKMMAGIDIKIVHFKGAAPAVVDLLGGHSHAMFGTGLSVLAHIQSGKFRAIATTGAKRSSFFPDVPTIAESGVPKYETSQWFGIVAPAGTPTPVVNRLSSDIKAILATDELKNMFMKEGAEVDYMGPAEFGKLIQEDITKWTTIAKRANIKPE
jgi:tripartite-type tricarboxylate transporter receptor subunit TctC